MIKTNGHGKYAAPDNETRHARFPDGTTSHSTRLSKNDNQVSGYLPIPLPQEGEGGKESLREFHVKMFGAALVLFAAFSATAEAKLYKWVDDKGTTHFGETIPPEYANKDRVQYNDKGNVIKKAAPAKDAASVNKAVEDQATIEQRRKDNALLNTYSNEKEIDLALGRNLQQVEARISSIHILQKSAQESLGSYQKEAEQIKAAGRKIPASLQTDIADAEKKIAQLKQDLIQAESKAAAVKASFAADKARYVELTGDRKK